MRRTEEPNSDLRTVPAGETWVGIVMEPRPHIAIATHLDADDEETLTLIGRYSAGEAAQMGTELIRLANSLTAPDN